MTKTSVTWAAGNAYADVQAPNYAIGYSDIDAEIECAWITTPNPTTASNTQITFSASEKTAVKMYLKTNDLIVQFVGYLNGSSASVYPDVQATDFHKYRVILKNGVADFYVDGVLVATRDVYTSNYNFEPLIYTADPTNTNKLAIKSIRWRKLS